MERYRYITVECSRCAWWRRVGPASPADRAADLWTARARRRELGACPACGDRGLDVVSRDMFGQEGARE